MMAVDVCSDIPNLVSSPRISFSYDLNQTDHHVFPLRSDSFLVPSSFDFDFRIVAQQISSADELFSNGKILPTQIKKIQKTPVPKHEPFSNSLNENGKKKRLKEFLFNTNDDEEEEEKRTSKSFWKFTRSTSLNFDNGKGKGLLGKLQKLSRSNSTGSAPIPKQMRPPKVLEKQNSQKQQPVPVPVPVVLMRSSSAASSNAYYHQSSKRPPLKKNCTSYGNGIKIIPVLNIPPAYASMGGLFGLGSFFCNGKDKKKNKYK